MLGRAQKQPQNGKQEQKGMHRIGLHIFSICVLCDFMYLIGLCLFISDTTIRFLLLIIKCTSFQ
jgi:hypothetical protein